MAVSRGRPRSTRLLVIGLVSASLLVITVDYRQEGGPLDELGGAVSGALAPLQEGVTAIVRPVENFFSGLANLPSMADENAALKDAVADLQAELATTAVLQEQLEQLQGLLDLRTALDPEGVPAVVIANGVSNFDWSVTINEGAADGIEPGMPVVAGSAGGARLVGSVVTTTDDSAVVQLIIDPGHVVAGVIGTGPENGAVVGAGDADMVMDYVKRVDPQGTGDAAPQVFTASYEINGQTGKYPPNLLIGTVSSTLEETNEGQATVTVRPSIDFSTLEYVMVLRSPVTPEEPSA